MRAIDNILDAITEATGKAPIQTGSDQWKAHCPSHDDKKPSLSITTDSEGNVGLHCHSGANCTHKTITAALGGDERMLFTESKGGNNRPAPRPRPTSDLKPKERKPKGDLDKLRHELDQARNAYTDDKAALLAKLTGVPVSAWAALRPGWADQAMLRRLRANGNGWPDNYPDGAFAFAEVNGNGEVIGMSFRPINADKGSPKGYSRGLSVAMGSEQLPGPILIVEGASDVAACAALEIPAVGRPSNKSGADMLAKMLDGQDVIVVGENDEKDNGNWPGRDGAIGIAERLKEAWDTPVRWSMPPKGPKDIREYLHLCNAGDMEPSEARRRLIQHLTDNAQTVEVEGKQPPPKLNEWRPFPTEHLPEPMRSMVEQGAKALQCDETYLALPMLSSYAAAIGNSRKIAVKGTWFAPCAIWTIMIGESGSSKSPAFNLVTKPISALQSKAFEDHREEMKTYEAEYIVYDEKLKEWKKQQVGDKPEEPEEPHARRYMVSDTTIEAIAPILNNNPRGLLVAVDEINSFFCSFGKYSKGKSGADSSHWLSMYSAIPLTVDRKTGKPKCIHVPDALASITGGIQPRILQETLGSEHWESGMAARFLMANPPRKKKVWTEEEIAQDIELAHLNCYHALHDLQPGTDSDGKPYPLIVKLSPEAKRLWVKKYNQHNAEQVSLHGKKAAAWAKLEETPLRIALEIHCVKVVMGNLGPDGDEFTVDVETMASAFAITDWFKYELFRVYDLLNESDEQRHDRELVEYIRDRHDGTITVRQLQQNKQRFRRDKKEAEAALQALSDQGFGEFEYTTPPGGGGHQSQTFTLTTNNARPLYDPENAASVGVVTPNDSGNENEVTI